MNGIRLQTYFRPVQNPAWVWPKNIFTKAAWLSHGLAYRFLLTGTFFQLAEKLLT
jgi:hypothetical protein